MKTELDLICAFSECRLCPRQCGVKRDRGQTGFCRAGRVVEIFSYGSHHGEEPVLSGTNGSGAIFFSRCNLRCLYCQNYPWSQEGCGEKYSVEELAGIFIHLKARGCHNWNLVSPTPWLPSILRALQLAGRDGNLLPVVYNTSGYERVQTLRALAGIVDIYLVDLRYATNESARLGSEALSYVEYSRAALRAMYAQAGALRLDDAGIARSGVICRLLLLPGLADEVCANLRWLAINVGTEIALSVMTQYTPAYKAVDREPWNRKIARDEYEEVRRLVEELGFTQGWIQEYGEVVDEELIGFKMKPLLKRRG